METPVAAEHLASRDLPFTTYNGPLAYSPPKYPSPWGRGSGNWSAAYQKATAFVRQLTLAEKVNITTGVGWEGERCVGNVGSVPRLGLHSLCMQDSPLGVRFADYVSAFPAGINVAATWDRSLAYARGAAMGQEARGKGVDVLLGPVCGPLGRAPLAGRNWEGFAPDPYLTGQLIAPTVEGIQSVNVMACTKHYIGNEQEHFRQAGEARGYGFNITQSVSSNIDDKTMHEMYLWPFADAVRAGTGSIMCSYQQINNSYGCSNAYTQNYLLKQELDFQGFIMSDWGAHHSGVSDALAGLDMSMPGDIGFDSGTSYWGANLTIAILNGTIPQYRLDDMATRIMAAYYYVGRDTVNVPVNFDSWTRNTYGPLHAAVGSESPIGLVNEHIDVRADHARVIRAIGQASTVLLKNKGALPLSGREKWTAIIGEDAGSNAYGANGCPDHGCDNGTLAMGWGSGTSDFPYLVTPEQAIQNYVLTTGMGEVFAVTDNYAQRQIVDTAKQATVALVFVNADSGEGYISVDGNEGDRNNFTLWKDGDRVIHNVTSVCNNTVVIIHSVGAVDVSAWYNNDNVTAIVWAGLPGQESGNALVDVLYGKVSPGGKLPFTIGRPNDYTTHVDYIPNNGQFGAPQQDFTEGLLIDYRGFDANGIRPIYEFGFGLSYTTFSYSNLQVNNVGGPAYVPTTGQTSSAPTYGSIDQNAQSYVFPSNISPVRLYIYPYLNSTDLRASSADPDYGQPASAFTPPGATDSSPQPYVPAGGAPGGNPGLWDTVTTVSVVVTNTGRVLGDEVAQLYVALGPGEPPKVLRGFERVSIAPGRTATVKFVLRRKDLSTWDTVSQNWIMVSNPIIYVGSSSQNLPLTQTLSMSAGMAPASGSSMSSNSASAPPAAQSASSAMSSPSSQVSSGIVPSSSATVMSAESVKSSAAAATSPMPAYSSTASASWSGWYGSYSQPWQAWTSTKTG